MKTPIADFIKNYGNMNTLRLHMPGHKGKNYSGSEQFDITEIDGADSLFSADGIIKESEQNASAIFGFPTLYSVEGSSLVIRTMVYLVYLYAIKNHKNPLILATRNAHKSFISALALNNVDVEWIFENSSSYLSSSLSPEILTEKLNTMEKLPVALYVTSPDYLGNTIDISGLSEVCKKSGILLLVDNAHGSYLKFMRPSLHPIDLGATMCCDSAHKTLPALTGTAYLHISNDADRFFMEHAKNAMSLFASTSPSYLLLNSLDLLNDYLDTEIKNSLPSTVKYVKNLKTNLVKNGFSLIGNEALKITISTKKYGYTGYEFNELLIKNNIYSEFYDSDFIVFMFGINSEINEINHLEKALLSIEKKKEITLPPPNLSAVQKAISVREAIFSSKEEISVENAEGRICADVSVSCPPAVPIIISGEIIDKNTINAFKYYGKKTCVVVKNQ